MLNLEESLGNKYPQIFRDPPKIVTRPLLGALRMLFHEREINRFLDEHRTLNGFAFIEKVLDHFHFSWEVGSREKENIPSSGRVVIIANHPLGALDALALIQLVGEVRPDVKVVANDLLTHLPPMRPLLLPVDNLNGATQKEQIKAIHEALDKEQAVIFFPAGEVSRLRPVGIRDGRWNSGFLRFARRADAPVLPVYIKARNSALFYGTSMISKALSALLLVQEMFSQESRTIRMKVGEIIPAANLRRDVSNRALVRMVKKHLYRVGKGREPVFTTEKAIAHPQPRQLIKNELKNAVHLGATRDDKAIYLFDYAPDSAVMKEIGRLRELSFRKVGEGSSQRRDLDRYDQDYRHLVLWDNDALEIVGSYRIGEADAIVASRGLDGLYTHTLFDLADGFDRCHEHALELGRSFVQPRYWGSRALDYLWQGIGAYVKHHPEIRHLYGPVSISDSYPKPARDALIHYYRHHFGTGRGPQAPSVTARLPYIPGAGAEAECRALMPGIDADADFKALRAYLQEFGLTVPTLYKQYTDVAEADGIHFLAFNVDPDFSNCVDGLICVDLTRLKPAKRKRYLED
ncbi:MAG: GNAT family N-acetyltransferase [Chromatiales bacterium]|nr:GNAT family N-acetyltransferase [Gammaproteobacteria bacterium]MCP5353035.1 GNAT family N-acetyltransferase [Chromatiales bacterium]